jgi:hypothetical protein
MTSMTKFKPSVTRHCNARCLLTSALSLLQVALNDVTLDDLWYLDLKKLDGWRCVKENTAGEDVFKEDDWESASDEGTAAGDDSD